MKQAGAIHKTDVAGVRCPSAVLRFRRNMR